MKDRKPWLRHYPPGVPGSLNYPEKPVFALLTEQAEQFPGKVCTVFRDQVISYRQMDVLTDALAAALVNRGLEQGDRVALYLSNLPQFVQAFSDLPIDLRLYPGEEVHPPENNVHIINFGASISINDLFLNEPAYLAGVKDVEDHLVDLPAGLLRYQYASCLWCYQKIRAAGGLAIFCHPYWVHNHSFNVSEALITRHLNDLPFDALELIGGYFLHEVESNYLQVARYNEQRALGKQIPIVGSSDSHGCENGNLFGWYYSIVFSPTTELVDIIHSIKELNSVAVECLPGTTPRAHGPYRLVKYAQFLLREVLPLHDILCAEEGRQMIEYLNGSQQAVDALRIRQGEIAALYTHLWG